MDSHFETETWHDAIPCRCCYRDIFSGVKFREKNNEEDLNSIIRNTFSLSLSMYEREYVCIECASRLRNARKFKELILETEQKFSNLTSASDGGSVMDMKPIKIEFEQNDSSNWDIDFLDMDDYRADSSPKVKKESEIPSDGVGKFKPADRKLKKILKKKKTMPKDSIKITVKKPQSKKLLLNTKLSLKGNLKTSPASNPLLAKLLSNDEDEFSVGDLLKVLSNKPGIKVIPPAKILPPVKIKKEVAPTSSCFSTIEKRMERQILKKNCISLVKNTNIVPFIHHRSILKCIFCGKSFVNFDQLKTHDDEEHSNRNIAVRKIYTYRDIMHVEITNLKCAKCDKGFEDVYSIKGHLISEHQVKFDMQHRDDVVEFKLLGIDGFKCHLCSREFHVFRNLSIHMNEHFPNYMCESCGKPFISSTRCLHHEENHKTGEYPCKRCGKVLNTINARNTHTLEHRASKYRCPHCSEVFNKYIERTYHMSEVHKITQRFVCDQAGCGKEFIHKPSFDAHRKSHQQKEKKVECNICGMKFTNNYSVKRHMISHTGERCFQCKVCGKKYARASTLREHMKIHNNDRRHVCSECGQAFVQKCSLKGHIKSRHPHMLVNEQIACNS